MEEEDSVFEAIVSKKRARDDELISNISILEASIQSITPEIIKDFHDYVKSEIINKCDDPEKIKFSFEIVNFNDAFLPSDPDDTPIMFEPLVLATQKAKTNLNLSYITDDKSFHNDFADVLFDYLEVLINAWNKKHPKVQIKSVFSDKDYIVYLENE